MNGNTGFANLITTGRVAQYKYITVDLLGPSLHSLLKNIGGPFGLPTVEKIGQKLLKRLQTLHEIGIVHCDIKPDNITIGHEDKDEIYLIDFGLAQNIESTDTPFPKPFKIDRIVGSLGYLSIGAHEGIVSFRNDIESMGYLLLFLLNGDLPWNAETIFKCGTDYTLTNIYDATLKIKKSFLENLPQDLPPSICRLFEAIRQISHVDRPEYEELSNILT